MATLNALMYDLSAGQQQLLTDLLFDTSTRKTTLPGDLDLGGNDLLNAGSFEPDILILPGSTSPAQTAEGSMVWDTDSDLLTVGDGAGRKTMVDLAASQTLLNKTIDGDDNTLQDIATSSLKSRTGSDANVVTGTAGVSGDLPVWDANGDIVDGPTPPSSTIVGISDAQTLTTKTFDFGNNSPTGTLAEFNTALSDETFCSLGGTETLVAKTLTSPVLTTPQINDTSLDHQYIFAVSELSADRTVTMPLLAGNDTFVFEDHAQTLTNKSIDGDDNTITDLPYSAIKSDSRTGSDTKLVTGTAAASGNLAMWDANGDVVDSTKTASGLVESIGDLDDVTETAVAAYDILYRNAGDTAWVNLAKGSEGYFLTITSGVLAWGVSGAGSMSSFSLAGDSGTPQTISDGNTLSVLTGNGLASVASATDTVTISPVADATGGANLSTCVDINANGLAIGVDDSTIEDDGSDQLRVKASGIGATELDATRNETLTGTINLTGGTITVPTPSTDADAATKAYVDSVAQGLDVHTACQAGSTQDISLEGTGATQNVAGGSSGNGQITFSSGPTTLDGYSLVNDDRILVKDCGTGTAEESGCHTVADSSGSLNNTWFVFYTTSTLAYYVWYNVNSAGSDPTPSPPSNVIYKGIEVAIATNETANDVATATKAAIDATVRKTGEPELIDCTVVIAVGNELTITNNYGGVVTNIADTGGTGFAVSEDVPGTGFNPCMNGIWVRTSQNTWDRADDMDGTGDHPNSGDFSFIVSGTAYGSTGWAISSLNPLDIDPSTGAEPVDWFQFSGAGTYTAKSTGGLNLDGTEFEVKIDATGAANLATVIKTSSNGTAIGVDDTTVEESAAGGLLRVKADGIGPTQIDETANYSWSGTDDHSGTLDLSSATLTVPLAISTPAATFTIVEESSLALAKYASCVAEMLSNAAVGGVSAKEAVYLTAAGTIDQAIASTPAHADSFMGIVAANAAAGQPVIIRKNCRALALFVGSLSLTVGDPVFLGLTAGQFTNVAPSSAGQVVLPVGHITDDLTYDGSADFTAEVELKQLSPMTIV